MTNFVSWLLDNIPEFFMSEPVIYFVALGLLSIIIKIISQLFFVERIK